MSSPSILTALTKLRQLLTRREKTTWLLIVLAALFSSGLELLTASIIMIFAQVLNQPELGQKYLSYVGITDNLPPSRTVFYFALLVGISYFIKNITQAFEAFYQNFKIQDMNYNFKNRMLHHYSLTDYEFSATRNSMTGFQIITSDIDGLFSTGMVALAGIISEGFIFISLVTFIIIINPQLAFMIFAIGLIMGFLVTKLLFKRFHQWGLREQSAARDSAQMLMQFLHGFKEIVLLGRSQQFIESYKKFSYQKTKVTARISATNLLPRNVIELVFIGLFVITISFLCFQHEQPIQMIGILGGYLYIGFRLMPGLNRLINQLNSFKTIDGSISRIHSEYNITAPQKNYFDIPTLVFNQSIEINNLSFNYRGVHTNILSNINLTINKGECIGIIGPTGSGKSTFVDLILGLLKPTSGTVLIDGQFQANSIQWHQKIGYVPQAIYLMDDTIAANIIFGDDTINHAQLQEAIKAAQLNDFIKKLPDGLNTLVGERGIKLSGGERQRIAIARALYRNPEVFIFDEATSALDNDTESRLIDVVNQVSQNRTVIMIAHRLTSLKNCHRIIEIDDGCIKNITNNKD